MNKLISEKRADMHINFVGIFCVASGMWELFLGLFAYESVTPLYVSGRDPLHIYNTYILILGLISIVIGMGIFSRFNFSRKAAIVLAVWNIFSNPVISIFMDFYLVFIRKISEITMPFPQYVFVLFLNMFLLIIPRIYIIYILRISKAGYIFLKKKNYVI